MSCAVILEQDEALLLRENEVLLSDAPPVELQYQEQSAVIEDCAFQTPIGDVVNIMGQEDLFRQEGGERVNNLQSARLVVSSKAYFHYYKIDYDNDEEEVLGETTGIVPVAPASRTAEHFIEGPLPRGVLYRFVVTIYDGNEEVIATSAPYYFMIGVRFGVPEFDPSIISRWHIWCEVGDEAGPSYADGDAVTTLYNASPRSSNSAIVPRSGAGTFKEFSLNGLPAVRTESGNGGYGSSADPAHVDRDQVPCHIVGVVQLPAGILGLSTYVELFRTGNLGTFGGYSLWRLFSNRIEVWSRPYGFFGDLAFAYEIELSDVPNNGEPFVVHIEGNAAADVVTVRINGSIVGGVSEVSPWTETAGSVSTGELYVAILPQDITHTYFSVLLLGEEDNGEQLDQQYVASTVQFLLDKYHINGEYEFPPVEDP